MMDHDAMHNLRLAAEVAVDYGDKAVKCDVRDLFEVTQEAADGRRCKARRDALAEALRDMLDLHHPTGRWQEEGGLNEVVAMRLEAATVALSALESE